jgi:CHASE2 domain-containing sensor protein
VCGIAVSGIDVRVQIVARIFISHSSRDNFEALAFKAWLVDEGWPPDDIFLDLHGIGAGERWKEALAKANERCEAVVLLASPESLKSTECRIEIRMAEDYGKEIIVAILYLLKIESDELGVYRERQIVDLSQEPREASFTVEHEGRQRTVTFNRPTLGRIKSRLGQLGISPTSFAWRPGDLTQASPYPGLGGFSERDAALFFGRAADIARGLGELRKLRRAGTGQILVVQAASGAGKSSFLRAGLWPRLQRDPDFTPVAILRPATGILTGETGMGRQVAVFLAASGRPRRAAEIHRLLTADDEQATSAFVALINEATEIGHAAKRVAHPDAPLPTPLVAVDQAEELFATADAEENTRFLRLIARSMAARPGAGYLAPPIFIWTIRADSMDALLHATETAGLKPPALFPLPPVPRDAYREIIEAPLTVANQAGMRLSIDPLLVSELIARSEGADALPLLAYTLRQLLADNRSGASAALTLAQYEDAGGIGGILAKRLAAAQRTAQAGPEELRRLFVPRLATWDTEAKRIVAREGELFVGNRGNLKPLADALVEEHLLSRASSEDGATTLEVAHEALLRLQPIAGWLEARKDDLKLRDAVLRDAKEWEDNRRHPDGLVRHGVRLEAALDLAASEDFKAALAPASEFLEACQRRYERRIEQRIERRVYEAWYHAAICFGALLGLLVLFLAPPSLRWAEHWAADWRTAWLSVRLPSSHPKIAIIDITEKSVEALPYLLPIHRGFLADIVDAADKAGARAIGLDFYFARNTEEKADEKLLATVRRLKDKLVLGVYESVRPQERAYQYAFIGDTPAGYIDLATDVDKVIRYRSEPRDDARFKESFSSRLSRAGGWNGADPPERIAWLLGPTDGARTFLTITAHDLLNATTEENEQRLKDRIVLIGSSLYSLDRHWTPLSLREDRAMVGVEVHAHMLAELIDGDRSYHELGPFAAKALVLILAIQVLFLGMRFQERRFDFLDWRAFSLLAILADLLLFKYLHLVLPFAFGAVAWALAVTAGTHVRPAIAWVRRRRNA